MKIIEKQKFNILKAEEGKVLRDKEQLENEEVYYFKEAYMPKNITLEECEEKFVEFVEVEK